MYDRKRVFAAACLGMAVFGIVLTTVGALLPSVIERFGVDKAHAGSLFLSLSLGILAGALVFAPIVDGYGYKCLLLLCPGLAVLLPLAFMAAIRFPVPKQAQGFPIAKGLGLLREPFLVLLGLTLFLQSGMEISVGGWTATYFKEELGLAGHRGLFFLSLYWLGMMLTRAALGARLGRISPAQALYAGIVTAFLGSWLLRAAREPGPAAAGLVLVGAGFAAAFPVVFALVGDRYASLSGTAFSIVLAMALTGGMLLPYLTGVLGQAYGLRTSFLLVPAALAVQALLLSASLRRAA